MVRYDTVTGIIGIHLLGLTGTATDLGQQQVNTEWCVLVVEEALQLGDLLLQHFWSIADTTDDTQTTGVGDRGRQLRASGHVHTSQQDRVVDLEQISNGSADKLWSRVIVSQRTLCQRAQSGRNLRGEAMVYAMRCEGIK